MAKNRSNAANSRHGAIVIRRDHAWEFCCGTFWSTTCHFLEDGEGMATWTGHLEGQGEVSFPGGPSTPQGARTIRCGKCNDPLLGLQRIKAAEHMIGDLVGDPGFKVWPTRPERDTSAPFVCEKCGKEIDKAGSDYCFSFDIWKGNETRSHAGGHGSFCLDEVGSPVFVSDHERPGFLCRSCEPDIATDLIKLAKKHKLNAIREGKTCRVHY